jgi:hypothetical protein
MERRIQQRANAFHQRNAQPHQLRTPMRNAPDHRQQWRQKGSRYLASPPRPPLDPRRAARGRSNGPARYRAALGTTSRSNPNNQISTVQGIARPSAMASSSIHRGRVIRHFLVAFTAGEAKGSNRSLGQITSPGIAYVAATARSDLSLSSKLAVGHDPLRIVDWQKTISSRWSSNALAGERCERDIVGDCCPVCAFRSQAIRSMPANSVPSC